MPIDRDVALSAPPKESTLAWTTRDVLLYHLSLGAGVGDEPELAYTYEKDLAVLPTFAVVAGQGISSPTSVLDNVHFPGIDVRLQNLLHGGQSLTFHRPLPTAGRAVSTTRIADIWDKGKAAVIVNESVATTPAGEPLWTSRSLVWARGEGGFGGSSGPPAPPPAPDRAPDVVIDTPTEKRQALLYRLNGDLNPLHADPDFAALGGLSAPILHGLASYGMVAKAVVDTCLGGDPTRLTGWSVRFAGMLWPGETLRTSIWADPTPETAARWRVLVTCPERDQAPVLTDAVATGR